MSGYAQLEDVETATAADITAICNGYFGTEEEETSGDDGGGGGLAFSYGDTQPVDKSLWLDTSEYASIQGAIPTQTIIFEGSEVPLIESDTQPAEDCLWLDTSGYSEGE